MSENAHSLPMKEGLALFEQTPNALLIDVRRPEEYSEGHLPHSRNLPMRKLCEVQTIIPEPATPLFVYCASGGRSCRASDVLRAAGYTRVTDLGGVCDYDGELIKD